MSNRKKTGIQKEVQKKKVYACLILLLAFTAAFMMFAFHEFQTQIYHMVYDKNIKDVEKLSEYAIKLLRMQIDEYISVLESAESFLEEEELFQETNEKALMEIQEKYGFTVLGISDRDGNAVNTDGKTESIRDEEFLEQVLKNQTFISDVIDSSKTEGGQILLAVPIAEKGEVKGVLYGYAPVSKLAETMEFDENSSRFFQIVDSQGTYIFQSENKYSFAVDSIPLWEELSGYEYNNGVTAEQIKNTMEKGESGSFAFENRGESRYVSYQPVGINNWYVFSTIITQEMDNFAEGIEDVSLRLLLQVFLAVAAAAAVIIFYVVQIYRLVQSKNEDLRIRNEMFRLVLQKTRDIPFEIDMVNREIIFYSTAFSEGMKRYSMDQISPGKLLDTKILAPESMVQYEKVYDTFLSKGNSPGEVVHLRYKGEYTWFKIILLTNGQKEHSSRVSGVLENYEQQHRKDMEIERRKQEADNLSRSSEKDFLTGLLNRGAFEKKTNEYLKAMPEDELAAFLILDLDSFKEVNDKMGHKMGDTVLKEIADILNKKFRKDDLTGRLGGDEFVILLKRMDTKASIEKLAADLIHLLEKTYEQNGSSVTVSASIGIAQAKKDGGTFEELYEKADWALYAVKRRIKNSFLFFDENL